MDPADEQLAEEPPDDDEDNDDGDELSEGLPLDGGGDNCLWPPLLVVS